MKKREEFAVNLRKKKKETIMKEKRKRFIESVSGQDKSQNSAIYRHCPLFLSEGLNDDKFFVQ